MEGLVGDESGDELATMVASTGALLQGHFRLQSGRHAEYFLRFGQLAFQTHIADRIAAIAKSAFALTSGTTVLCAETAGRYLGAALARALDADVAIAEVDEWRRPTSVLRRGTIRGASDVIVATDVVTTGRSLLPLLALAREARSRSIRVVAFARLDDGPAPPELAHSEIPVDGLMQGRWTRYVATDCALCRNGIPLIPAMELN